MCGRFTNTTKDTKKVADRFQVELEKALERSGAGSMILQQDLSGEKLAEEITALANDPERVSEMEAAARKLARGDAAAAVVDLIEELVTSGSKQSAMSR